MAIFELTDLELVDIGQNFIKIGPEMRILERFFEIGPKHLDFDGIAVLAVIDVTSKYRKSMWQSLHHIYGSYICTKKGPGSR